MDKKAFEPLRYIVRIFELDEFEEYCLKSVWENQGKTPEDLLREYGNVESTGRYFWPESVLMRYFLRWHGNGKDRHLVLDERMSVFLQGNISGYAPYDLLWERIDPIGEERRLIGKDPEEAMERFFHGVSGEKPLWFHLYGSAGMGKKSHILEFCKKKKRSLLIIDREILIEENQELLGLALRECRIYGAWLMIRNMPEEWFVSSFRREKLFAWIGIEAGVLFTTGENPAGQTEYEENFSKLELELPMPGYAQSCLLWENAFLNIEGSGLFPEEWANKFVFTPGQMKEAVEQASRYAGAEGKGFVERSDLQRGCYRILRENMGKKAVKIPAAYTWEELILPDFQKQKLRDSCNQAASRKRVYENWGFGEKIAYGRGISVVFAGPPGTGKTMAAQVMSTELCMDLYRVELPAIVSKYVGETEKNLEEIFEQAKKSQVILFFDEADVLFSKRTEVREANDKYSNMEAAFLLQKMEEYEGITILATNFLQNFDEAFKRRMKFIIDFPFPEEKQRFQIWKQVFPKKTPTEDDLDYEFLAAAFELSGSNIKNAALHAAFLAAAEETSVGMRQVISGVRNEYSKIGKTLTKEQMGQYYMLL